MQSWPAALASATAPGVALPPASMQSSLPSANASVCIADPPSPAILCSMLLQRLRQKSRFALKVTDMADRMPLGKEMKVMLGGLEGLAQELNEAGVIAPAANIHVLVAQAPQHFDGLASLPYDRIIRSITTCQVRHRVPSDPAK